MRSNKINSFIYILKFKIFKAVIIIAIKVVVIKSMLVVLFFLALMLRQVFVKFGIVV